jgi:hypothetical protein
MSSGRLQVPAPASAQRLRFFCACVASWRAYPVQQIGLRRFQRDQPAEHMQQVNQIGAT